VRAAPPDRFDLYERAAQAPTLQARFLRALLGADPDEPSTLREDFSGTGAVSRAWLALYPASRAVCVDHDAPPLDRLRERAGDAAPRLTIRECDVRDADDPADCIAALNFSIGEIHSRAGLVEHFRRCRARLRPGGVLALDIYGGADAYVAGESDQELRGPAGERVKYVWEQREADPLTGMVVNAMHFFPRGRPAMRDAFVYRWRLWSIPELHDALAEAGLGSVEFHDRLADAMDERGVVHLRPMTDSTELEDNWVLYLAARPSP
jgi:SAM-dependent methyltransferase